MESKLEEIMQMALLSLAGLSSILFAESVKLKPMQKFIYRNDE